MKQKNGIIYKVTNLINGKCYIGKTIQSLEERKRGHIKESMNTFNNSYFHKALIKYGIHNFKWEIIYECEPMVLNVMETFKIIVNHTHKSEGGYNLTWGGDGGPLLEETKKKISTTLYGHVVADKTRKKLSNINKGKVVSDETKKKISESTKGNKNGFFGKKHTEETKKKMRKGSIGKNIGRVVTSDTRQKLSFANKGKVASDETKKKISEGHRKYSDSVVLEAKKLRQSGMSFKCISNLINVPRCTIQDWCKNKYLGEW